jgi:ribonuclease P protein component
MKTSELIYSQGKSIFSYPFKVIFRDTQVGDEVLIISVPKKIFKRAVKRNLIRRRIREAFRLNCRELPNIKGKDILLVYVSSHILDYGKITETLTAAISKVGTDS